MLFVNKKDNLHIKIKSDCIIMEKNEVMQVGSFVNIIVVNVN